MYHDKTWLSHGKSCSTIVFWGGHTFSLGRRLIEKSEFKQLFWAENCNDHRDSTITIEQEVSGISYYLHIVFNIIRTIYQHIYKKHLQEDIFFWFWSKCIWINRNYQWHVSCVYMSYWTLKAYYLQYFLHFQPWIRMDLPFQITVKVVLKH